MENPADHQCIEWKATFPVNMFVSDRFYRPQLSRVCRLPGLLRQTHVRDTGEAAIRVDGSHCTKSVTAAATYDTDDEAVAIATTRFTGFPVKSVAPTPNGHCGSPSACAPAASPSTAAHSSASPVGRHQTERTGPTQRRAGLQGIPRNQDHRPARLMKFCATSAKVSLSV